jgi:hypothetical protein
MAYNEELVKRLAAGDVKAQDEIKNLPTAIKMGLGIAVDEYRKQNDIQQTNDGFSLYDRKKASSLDNDAMAAALAKRLEETKIKEEILQKQRQEHAEKVAKQMTDRARALGSFQ